MFLLLEGREVMVLGEDEVSAFRRPRTSPLPFVGAIPDKVLRAVAAVAVRGLPAPPQRDALAPCAHARGTAAPAAFPFAASPEEDLFELLICKIGEIGRHSVAV